jgi:hypothetical protein
MYVCVCMRSVEFWKHGMYVTINENKYIYIYIDTHAHTHTHTQAPKNIFF